MKQETKPELYIEDEPKPVQAFATSRYKRNCIIDAISCLAYYLVQDESGAKAVERFDELKKRGHIKVENKRHEDWIWNMAETIAYPPKEMWRK